MVRYEEQVVLNVSVPDGYLVFPCLGLNKQRVLGSGQVFLLGGGRNHWGIFCLSFQFSPFSETAWTLSFNKCLGIEKAGEWGYGLDLAFSGTFYFWGGFLII